MIPPQPLMMAYPLIVVLLFVLMRTKQALVWSFVLGWLFLPMARLGLGPIPDIGKEGVVALSVLIAALIIAPSPLLAFRPRWFDMPILTFTIVSPIASSMFNNLGLYDGVSEVYRDMFIWFIPYLLGRAYLKTLEDIRALTLAIFGGGLIYIPFCLFEMKYSPMLHEFIYGYSQHWIVQAKRFGGWRPMVFMQHGLMVGVFMGSAVLAGFAIWREGRTRSYWGMPFVMLLGILAVVAIFCRSMNAWLLLFLGLGTLSVAVWQRSRWALWVLVILPLLYLAGRGTGLWHGEEAVALASMLSEDRAASLQHRINSENLIVAKAMQHPFFGWGGWGRWIPEDVEGNALNSLDGMWVIILGKRGLLGLSMWVLMLLMPACLILRQQRYDFSRLGMLPMYALATMVTLYLIDCLPNAMPNPLYMVAAGAIASVAGARSLAPAMSAQRQPLATPPALNTEHPKAIR